MFAPHRCLDRFAFFITLGFAALLVACGSGSTFQPLKPTRVISFGDGLSDLGQTGARFTVNDGSANIWVERVATSYGNTITAQISGGLGYAQGGARISSASTDGSTTAVASVVVLPSADTIAAQISAFLAANTIGASDLLIIDTGISELAALANANPTDNAALATAATASGRSLAAQVLRLTAAGGKHVVIANAPDLGKAPFATLQTRTAALTAATRAFNDSLKINLASVTADVLLIDNEAYVNALIAAPTTLNPAATALTVSTPACATATFNTTGCTTATLNVGVTSATYSLSLFSDDRHLTPAAHRLVGDNAYNKIKNRW